MKKILLLLLIVSVIALCACETKENTNINTNNSANNSINTNNDQSDDLSTEEFNASWDEETYSQFMTQETLGIDMKIAKDCDNKELVDFDIDYLRAFGRVLSTYDSEDLCATFYYKDEKFPLLYVSTNDKGDFIYRYNNGKTELVKSNIEINEEELEYTYVETAIMIFENMIVEYNYFESVSFAYDMRSINEVPEEDVDSEPYYGSSQYSYTDEDGNEESEECIGYLRKDGKIGISIKSTIEDIDLDIIIDGIEGNVIYTEFLGAEIDTISIVDKAYYLTDEGRVYVANIGGVNNIADGKIFKAEMIEELSDVIELDYAYEYPNVLSEEYGITHLYAINKAKEILAVD